MNPDWRESLEWMGNNTPATGVDYYTIYNPKTFQYPAEAYGVMSWWDYGHMITYIAKRIPNANPFQAGVVGPTGSANYFMSISEDEGNQVLDRAKTRYVITDIEMDTSKFWQWRHGIIHLLVHTLPDDSPYSDPGHEQLRIGPAQHTAVLLHDDLPPPQF